MPRSRAVRGLAREDWLRAALSAMAEGGVRRIAVEPLARTLGASNAATSTALLEALAARWRVVCADLPGRPGLSTSVRPREDDRVHGRWLRQVLHEARGDQVGRVVLVGHSRGAAVALALSVAWLLRPTDRAQPGWWT